MKLRLQSIIFLKAVNKTLKLDLSQFKEPAEKRVFLRLKFVGLKFVGLKFVGLKRRQKNTRLWERVFSLQLVECLLFQLRSCINNIL